MRKGKRLIGRPILSLTDGVGVGTVKDIILGPENDQVIGLLTDEGGMLSSAHFVPLGEVQSFGKDAIVVRSTDSVLPADRAPEIKGILERGTSLLGIKVFTDTGEAQGTVNDVYFDESSGRVTALEISGGTISNFTGGLRNLPVEDIVRTGPEVLFVRPEAAEAMALQRGGVSGAIADAGDKAKDAGSQAGTTVGEWGETASQKTAEAHPEDQLVGRRTGRDIEDDQGAVLVPGGKFLTQDDIQRARDAGKTNDLFVAVGAEQLDATKADLGDAAATAGDQAVGLWDTFTRKVGEMTDATGKRVDEEQTKRQLTQIEDAVGRPVTKVILDLQDRVVLDLGDIITHRAVQQAHEAGALDSLLGSVYKADVQFDKDELRAQRPGAAALEQAEGAGGAQVVEELRGKVEQSQAEREAASAQKKEEAEAARQAREGEREQRAAERDEASKQRKESRSASPEKAASGAKGGSGDVDDDGRRAGQRRGGGHLASAGHDHAKAFRRRRRRPDRAIPFRLYPRARTVKPQDAASRSEAATGVAGATPDPASVSRRQVLRHGDARQPSTRRRSRTRPRHARTAGPWAASPPASARRSAPLPARDAR